MQCEICGKEMTKAYDHDKDGNLIEYYYCENENCSDKHVEVYPE